MNIFATSSDPVACAKYLCDKRAIKMALETAQMLSTAVRSLGVDTGYKATHANHPCNVWARKSRQNFKWLCDHGLALCNEYTERYGKIHKSQAVIEQLTKYVDQFADLGLTEMPNCTTNKALGIDYRDVPDVHRAYQLYLNDRWDNDKKQPTWGGRSF